MSHPARFRTQVAHVDDVWQGFDRHALDHLDPVLSERVQLSGVVRHDTRASHTEFAQHCGGRGVVASVDREAERDVRVDRVEATVLKRVRADLVEQTDAASLVAEVEEHAAVGAPHLLEAGFELLAAVAAERAERLTGQAFGMKPHEHRLITGDLAVDEGDHLGLVAETEDVDLEIAMPRRERRGRL